MCTLFRWYSLLLLSSEIRAQSVSISMPSGVTGYAYRNQCTTSCPLLIYLHGLGQTVTTATMANMRDLFTGITAVPQETTSGLQSWPASSSNSHYSANLVKIRALISMTEVDSSRVHLIGFSNGGFYCYLLACTIGNELAGIVVLAGLKEVQPTCPHRTNVLHLHNANDNLNIPVDVSGSTKGGAAQLGTPTGLRTNWLAAGSGSSGSTINGASGATQGAFTLFSATSVGGQSFLYWSYNGPAEHAFTVYPDNAANRPDSPLTQAQYIMQRLLPSLSPPPLASPPPSAASVATSVAAAFAAEWHRPPATCVVTATAALTCVIPAATPARAPSTECGRSGSGCVAAARTQDRVARCRALPKSCCRSLVEQAAFTVTSYDACALATRRSPRLQTGVLSSRSAAPAARAGGSTRTASASVPTPP
jgi:dienelactone hydrolase